jgi:hypothetical protein
MSPTRAVNCFTIPADVRRTAGDERPRTRFPSILERRPPRRPHDGIAAECRRGRKAAGGTIGSAPRRFKEGPQGRVRAIMGVRTRASTCRRASSAMPPTRAARAEAEAVIQRWNDQFALSRDMLWSPTIRAALLAGTPWLDVFCPGCGTSRAIDLRKVDRHPLASVATLVLGLRCSWCPESAPMPRILGLHALPPAAKAVAANL